MQIKCIIDKLHLQDLVNDVESPEQDYLDHEHYDTHSPTLGPYGRDKMQ